MKKIFSLLLAFSVLLSMFSFFFTASAAEAQSGVCAIGEVNTADKTAVALFGDGSVKIITYTGADPVPGEVHDYSITYNLYTLTQKIFMPNYPTWSDSTIVNVNMNPPYPYLWLPYWGSYIVYLDRADASFFVRYNQTQWRVFTGTDILKAQNVNITAYVAADFSNSSHFVFTAGLIGDKNAETGAIIPATADQTKVFDANGVGWSEGDKDLSFSNPSLTRTGFCAIGDVDIVSKTAVALFGNGIVKKISYTGANPIAGEVHEYTEQNNIYTLSQTLFLPNYPATSSQTVVNVNENPPYPYLWLPYWGSYILYLNRPDASFFIRYSKTDWRVVTGTDILKAQNVSISAYVRADFSDSSHYVFTAGLIGGINTATGQIVPATEADTKVFDEAGIGWSTGNKNVSFANPEIGVPPAPLVTGFCAVGEVNTARKTAVALFSNGDTKRISYTGTDPIPGEVHEFSLSENTYTLSQAQFLPNYPTVNDSTLTYVYEESGHMYLPNWGGYNIFLEREDASFFVRYSKTEWRVLTGTQIFKAQSEPTTAYVRADFSNMNHIVFTAGMIGDKDSQTGEIIPATTDQTKVFDTNGVGFANGDKSLTYRSIAATGDVNFDKAVDISDLIFARNVIIGKNKVYDSIDTNNDNEENIVDLLNLKNQLLTAAPVYRSIEKADLLSLKADNSDISAAALESSIVSSGNNARLKAVIEKAERGEDIVLGFIGGSITEGMSATYSSYSYSYRVYQWFRTMYPNSNIGYVNAGIGSTGSLIGVHRLEEDLLSKNPDLILIDFAVNDSSNEINSEAYEAIVRRCLLQPNDPAVMLMFFAKQDFTNVQDIQTAIGEKYNLPMISYKNAVEFSINQGKFTWSDISPDYVHPNDRGHKIAADLIIHRLRAVRYYIGNLRESIETLPDSTTRFMNATLLNNQNIIPVSWGSFIGEDYGYPNATLSHGISSSAVNGDSFVFQTDAKVLTLLYKMMVLTRGAKAEVRVDGNLVATIDSDFPGGFGEYANTAVVINRQENITSTVEIKIVTHSDPTNTNGKLLILGILES